MPCNQFGQQEPGTAQEVEAFAQNLGAKFPVCGKVDVNGSEAHPLYVFLKASSGSEDIAWNFAKFLVSSDGTTVKFFGPKQNPLSFEEDIATLLA
mmetsp:Transcript_54545/g.70105  ORF Transcript_54545/g.70105 Transcript_54545/m.70105 type:complete len:95 (-) Transcript_54545:295-579(-)|eukprot:CAMPEP_0114354618 /NCGR_PEP_ID=MMETSP0101-20121206/19607_1 /TAXON_ID=38822 ORGANISM="Pteridomonas danica, Strain PT" /NCGR_SAMPLE_ID=MMETSP0101 /ASSEMBLY_ACC=CAM_ASM_000211 /LENGTH=94 /DNA_ID=CAMNT_0001496161 /DNA_START=167 /DNA_END=451 /DNA_ORIENTATION=+